MAKNIKNLVSFSPQVSRVETAAVVAVCLIASNNRRSPLSKLI